MHETKNEDESMKEKKSIRVVIAEDDFLVSVEIERILKSKGYEIVGKASNGNEALELVHSQHPDVVVMDIKMPEVDGLEASRLVQESCPTPVVVLTAHETDDFLEKASAAGVGAYLVKPPHPGELERGISIAMARHGDLMKLRQLYLEIEAKNNELEKALEEIKTLRGIVPICSFCKKIRDDEGFWNQVEAYMSAHSEARFSHSVCPQCLEENYPEFADEILTK